MSRQKPNGLHEFARPFRLVRPLSVTATALVVGLTAVVAVPGADSFWLVAVGRVVAHGHVLLGTIPYADAPGQTWVNVPVLGELVFAGLYGVAGVMALVAAQVLSVGLAFGTLSSTMRREGATDGGAALVIAAVALGSVGSLVVARAQMFSLVLFPLLVALLTTETRSPSRRAWILAPLMAVWSMSHGGVLVGAAVAASWLILERFRHHRAEAVVLLASIPVAICVTPALARTPIYYRDVLTSEAVRRAYGLWAPLGLDVLDGLLVTSAVGLAFFAARARPQPWLVIAAAGLTLMTLRAPRNGVWLLFLLAPSAARMIRVRFSSSCALPLAGVAVAAVLVGTGLGHAGSRGGEDSAVVELAANIQRHRLVLADPLLAEKVVVAGGRVWIANPIEAFTRPAQRQWLDWLQQRVWIPPSLENRNVAVLVQTDTALGHAVASSARFRPLRTAGGAGLYALVPQP